ncbi:MAG: ABC transporter ATP-binding protein [Thermoanaerobacterales bacterium]|nr:ABC transporter ATP-binding protein [Thermoanaerobacterales bacterium]
MLIRLLASHLRPYRGLLAAVVVLQAVQALATLYLPTLNADIIDHGILPGDDGYIRTTGAVMLGVTLVQVVFAVAAVWCGARVAMGFGRDVRNELFHRVTSFSAREVNLFGAPSLITRITNDVQQVQMLVVMTCTLAVSAPVMFLGGIVLAVRQDVGLSWLFLVSLPALALSIGSVVRRMVPLFRRMQDRIDGANDVLREQITGIRVVRAFVREPEEVARFERVNDELTDVSLAAGRLMAVIFPTMLLIVNASSVGVLWFGGIRVDAGDMSAGSLVAFLTYFTVILMSVMMGMFVAIMAPRAAVCAERIVEVLRTEPSVRAAARPVTEVTERGTLEMRDAAFRYPGAEQPVLEGVSFRTLPGQTLAVVGSTGSGKTTLVNLVARLMDVTEGAVLVDGVDVRDLAPDLLWERIGLVPQKPYLFSGTVASNLRYGKPDATDDELWEALRVAQAADFVAAMGGLDATIAQGGANVSGGQRQRLAIARALVKRPEIYLFDDSFSALDLATDARLRAALVPYVAGSTVVIVAQRISTIRDADQILVLEGGRQVGLGTHDELLRTCATYAEIVESQAGQGAAA